MSTNNRTGGKRDYVGVLSSVSAIVIGLLVGFIILLICNPPRALPGFVTILAGAFTHGPKSVGQVFYCATSIILADLSVGFAFKTGLFNIDTPGQFIVGAFAAVYVGIMWTGLGRIRWAMALLAAIPGGALWEMVPGPLKACFNVNEVIASIIMNYIGMYMVNWIVKSYKSLFNNLHNESRNVAATAQIPKMGTDKLFPEPSVGGDILLVIAAVLIIWVVLSKITFGYEPKAVGFNRDASRYAGINEKRNIIISMVIAGVIADTAGGLLYLAGTGKHTEIKDVLASKGFTGISVALLGLSHPIGVLFSGLFIAYLTAEGFYLQLFELSMEIIDIIVAVIIYFSTFALIVKTILTRMNRKREKGGGQI